MGENILNKMTGLFFVLIIGMAGCGGGGGGGVPDTGGDTLSPPANLQAASLDGSVSLSWSSVAGATSYNVYMATVPGVSRTNYSALAGGAVISGQTSPALVTSLTNGVTYYFVVTAVKAGTTKIESPESAEARAMPVSAGDTAARTEPATSITNNSANLHGSFTNPAGYTTTVWLEYGSTPAYGTSTSHIAYSAVGLIPITIPIDSLSQLTTFHYRLVTQNSGGIFYGGDMMFSTLATPQILAFDLDAPAGLPFDGTYAYWLEIYGGRLRRANVITGEVTTLTTVPTGGNSGCIATDSNYVYFTASGSIMRADLDGSNLNQNFSPTANTSLIVPHSSGIYVRHSSDIFSNGVWTTHYYISRISLDGSIKTLLYERAPTGSTGFGGDIVIDETNIYWSDYFQGTIQKMALSGGSPVIMALGLNHPFDLLLDGTTLFAATDDGIKKIPTAGGILTTVSPVTGMMTKNGNDLYVAGNGIAKIDLLTGIVTPLVGNAEIGSPPVVTGDLIYWIVSGSRYSTSYGRLERLPKL